MKVSELVKEVIKKHKESPDRKNFAGDIEKKMGKGMPAFSALDKIYNGDNLEKLFELAVNKSDDGVIDEVVFDIVELDKSYRYINGVWSCEPNCSELSNPMASGMSSNSKSLIQPRVVIS